MIVQFDCSIENCSRATDFVNCIRLWPVNLLLGYLSWEQTVNSSQYTWFEGDFELLLL